MNSTSEISGNQYLSILFEAAHAAGKAILEVYDSSDFQTETKEDNSPLTLADRNAHLAIVDKLNVTGLPILSEEGKKTPYSERSKWEEFWMVDPLDGTKEFVKRNGEFTVNIALIKNGEPVLGIVYAPVTDNCWFGEKDKGAHVCHSFSLSIDNNLTPEFTTMICDANLRPYTVVGSRSHSSPETEKFVASLKSKYGELTFISAGSSLKICKVAEGLANIYPRLAPTMEWDTAAGHAVAVAAGCHVFQYEKGESLKYNKENLLNPWFVVEAMPR